MVQYTLTSKGTLRAMRPSSTQSSSVLGSASPEALLLNLSYLPSEVLLKIFKYFNADTKWHPYKHHWERRRRTWKPKLVSLMLVCRRFRDLAEPILYQRVSVNFDEKGAFWSRRTFLKTVQKRPSLCQHIQQLAFIFSNRPYSPYVDEDGLSDAEKDIKAAVAFLLSINPHKLILEGEWHTVIDHRLCLAIARFELQKLQVASSWGHFVFLYLHWGRCSALRKLTMNFSHTSLTLHQSDLFATLTAKGPAIDQEFSVCVDILVALGGGMTAEELYSVCRFIEGLKKFRLVWVVHQRYTLTYTRSSLQNILDLHQKTLEEVELPIYYGNCIRIPNFMAFSSLKRLFLSWNNLVFDTPSIAMQKLAAPLLEHLTLDMDQGDQQIRGTGVFADNEMTWLTEFVRCRESSSCLKHCHIILEWECDYVPYYGGPAENYPWPHRHLEVLKPKLAELGMALTCDKPPLTEEQWCEQLLEAIQRSQGEEEQEEHAVAASPEHSQDGSDSEGDEIEILSKLPLEPPDEGSAQKRVDTYFSVTRDSAGQ